VVADVAVVAGEADLAAAKEIVEAARVRLVAKAEQDAGGNIAIGEATSEQGERRYSDATPHENGAGGALRELFGLGEAVAERAVDPDPLTRLQRTEAIGAGADPLDQEVEAPTAAERVRVGDREGARQEWAAGALLPVSLAGEHVELPGQRLRAVIVAKREEPVAARGVVVRHLAGPTPPRCDLTVGYGARRPRRRKRIPVHI